MVGAAGWRAAARSQGRRAHRLKHCNLVLKAKSPKPRAMEEVVSHVSALSFFLFFLPFCPLGGPGLLFKQARGEDVLNPQSPQVFSTKGGSVNNEGQRRLQRRPSL